MTLNWLDIFVETECCMKAIHEILDGETDPKEQDLRVDTPLHMVSLSFRKNIGSIKELINAGADVNLVNVLGITPLHYAAMYRHLEMVKALLQSIAKDKAWTFFAVASLNLFVRNYWHRNNRQDVIRSFQVISNGNISNSDDQSSPHTAFPVQNVDNHIAYVLLRHGASVCILDGLIQTQIGFFINGIGDDRSLLFAKRFIKMVVFENNISQEVKSIIEKHSELSLLQRTCNAEMVRMKNEIISRNLTVYDFLLDCFNEEQFEDLLLDFYKPVVDILMTGCYSVYLLDILLRFEKFELLRVLRYNLYLRNRTEDFRDSQTMKFLRIYNNCVLSNYVSHWELFRLILSHSNLADNEIKNINALEI